MSSGPDLETVAIVYSQPQLALFLSLLEQERIWVVPISYAHVSVQWSLTLALGGVQLRVHASDADAAWKLLAGLDRFEFSRRGLFSDNRLVDVFLIVGLFLVGFFVPPARIPAFFPDRPMAVRQAG
jgi:hypothetical protein